MRQLLILIFGTSVLFSSCKRTNDLSEEEVYAILNEIITDSVLHVTTLCSTFDKASFDKHSIKVFSTEDIKFARRQVDRLPNMSIETNKIKRIAWKTLENKGFSPFADIISPCADSIFHYHISFPIISADKKKVIIKVSGGGGFNNGGQETFLFEKLNNNWVVVDTWDIIYTINGRMEQRQVTANVAPPRTRDRIA